MKYQFYKQHDILDCGPTCLRMIAKTFGRNLQIQTLRALCSTNRGGSTLSNISDAAEKIGMRTLGVRVSIEQLKDVQLPCILHWRQSHYVVLYEISKGSYTVADPGKGIVKLSEQDFKDNWFAHRHTDDGIALVLGPTPAFYEMQNEKVQTVKWGTVLQYYFQYKKLFLQLFIGLGIGTFIQLVTPFLTQAIVDTGINTKDLNFIYLILIAQLFFFLGQMAVNFMRSWILLHVSTRINLAILTDFLGKLMRLPLSYFESKTTGDIMQRMADQQKIESFLTTTALGTLFSMVNLVVFTFVLISYSKLIFLISLFSTLLYTGWIILFLKRRRDLNYRQFQLASSNQSAIVEIVTGMQEIKLNNCETQKRWDWENIQVSLYKFKIKNLALSQTQQIGSSFINQLKNIIITFISVKAVIDGDMTLGGMMAIQYIVGQVSNPIEQMLGFFQTFQDAKISLERLNEVHTLDDEEPTGHHFISQLPVNKSISISNLSFKYPGSEDNLVLENIDLDIPEGKTTAIVGMSGSGKTTLLKLLLRIHRPEIGRIKVGKINLSSISHREWRKNCGIVMQDGYIFRDTLANNIAVGDNEPDYEKLIDAIEIANLTDFVNELPFGLYTKVGVAGQGISQGQKQRILIARAIYKNPAYLFFDEATNALDTTNERMIMENLDLFTKGRTVVVVAHRLSTVKNADNIIVLQKGKIVERGSHQELTELKGAYFELVRNQLEFGE